jgi:type IV fimbrial biogenesis protein FimT
LIKIRLQKGFSMVELLFGLAIFSLMLSLVIPQGRVFMGKNRAIASVNELRAALQFTRISAIKLGECVTLCGSRDRKQCDGSWQEGQIVITDSHNVLRVLSKIFAGDKLIWKGGIGAREQITFLPNGKPKEQKGHFYYCPGGSPENASAVFLEATGRVRISDKTAEGKTISCNY